MYGMALNAYKRTSLAAINDRERAVKLLYEGAIKELHLAKSSLNTPISLAKHIGKVIAIIGELQAGLNFEKGGEAAEFLYGLYAAIIRELSKVRGPQEEDIIERSIRYLSRLRDIWEEQVLGIKRQEAQPLKQDIESKSALEAHI